MRGALRGEGFVPAKTARMEAHTHVGPDGLDRKSHSGSPGGILERTGGWGGETGKLPGKWWQVGIQGLVSSTFLVAPGAPAGELRRCPRMRDTALEGKGPGNMGPLALVCLSVSVHGQVRTRVG